MKLKKVSPQEEALLNKISIRKNPDNYTWWKYSFYNLGMICNICDKLFNCKSGLPTNIYIKHARRHINESNLKVFL